MMHMKVLRNLIVAAAVAAAMTSCAGDGSQSWSIPGSVDESRLPTSSGKAGEVIVIMKKAHADGELGTVVRKSLGGECQYLEPVEPQFNVSLVPSTVKSEVFHQQRNLVVFDIESENTPAEHFRTNVWAKPQAVVSIRRSSVPEAIAAFDSLQTKIVAWFDNAERERVIEYNRKYEARDVFKAVSNAFGGSPHFPNSYSVRKATENFVWVDDTKQYVRQGVLMFKYPVGGESQPFLLENMLRHRNELLKENVPGMFEGTYMTTSTYVNPSLEYINDKGRRFAQMRGYWDVEGDFMGGPFVDHFFYSEDGKYIILLDAFVYAPKFDKRHYLRQVESILYTFESSKKSE